MANTNANLIWKIADLLRGPYQPNQYGDYIPEEDGGVANNLPELPAPERAAETATNVVPLFG